MLNLLDRIKPMKLIIIFSYFLTSVETVVHVVDSLERRSFHCAYWICAIQWTSVIGTFTGQIQTRKVCLPIFRRQFLFFFNSPEVFSSSLWSFSPVAQPIHLQQLPSCLEADDRCKYACIHALYWRILFWIKCTSTTCVFHILFVCWIFWSFSRS